VKRICLSISFIGLSAVVAGAATEITYVELVHKLTDLEGLAVLPSPGETCRQWSSYDRASRYDEKTDKYLSWGANGDANGIIRQEGDVSVLAEMDGPGCIWRIWSAAPGKGHVKIYLDGAAEPAVDLPFMGYFDGHNPPFTYASIVHTASRGQNCYLPMPYQKSCKIVADKDWGGFYHVGYTTYPKGTIVPTFKRELSPQETAALAAASEFLANRLGADPAGERPGQVTEVKKVVVPAKGKVAVVGLEGARAITGLRVRVEPAAVQDVTRALREVVLQIRWDGEERPSIWAPLGDFFGTAPGTNKYKSLPLGMFTENAADTKWCCYSYWYMPFAKGAAIELVNDGPQTFPLECEITHAPLARPASELGRFHAKWHRDALLNTVADRTLDWPLLRTEGRGRFCGVMLHVWNPRGGWWGEGDEKLFVDGEKFPSTFGTGSEDYFGYAWGDGHLFQHAYHDQTVCDGNGGNTSLNRWHITDNVPFQKSFEGSIEKYWDNQRPCQYAAVAYWYLAPGQADAYQPVGPVTERTDYRTPLKVYDEPGVLEGESLRILSTTGGMTHVQRMIEWGDGWSGGQSLWWERPRVGDKLTLALPVAAGGAYDVGAQFTVNTDRAILQLYLDDAKLGEPVDCYRPHLGVSGLVALGRRELTAGEHKLTIEVTGANDKARNVYQVGLDYVKLAPAK